MPSGSCDALSELPDEPAHVIATAPRAVLGTLRASGEPHLVPVCYAMRGDEIVSAIDAKPKSLATPARIRNIERDARVTLLVDRWDDDWSRLAWVMVHGRARVDRDGDPPRELVARYPQYADSPPQGPVIVVTPERLLWWWTSR